MECGVSKSSGGSTGPPETHLPKAGMVNQVCREWLVHEDSALAYKLQEKEIEMHYGKNRQQRKLIRTDLQEAKILQDVEMTEAHVHDDVATHLQQRDERLARQLQEELENEASEKLRYLELADKELAEEMQKRETRQEVPLNKRLHNPHKARAAAQRDAGRQELLRATDDRPARDAVPSADDDNGSERPSQRTRSVQVALQSPPTPPPPPLFPSETPDDVSPFPIGVPTPGIVDGERSRVHQEKEDERLARLLQEEEALKKSQTYKDQQLAIEVQDRELARLLQEQERARARKARHRSHKAKLSSEQPNQHGNKDEGGKHLRHSPTPRRMSEAVVHSDSSEACSTGGSSSERSRKPARPTNLSVSSSYSQESRVEPPARRRDLHNTNQWRGSPHSDNFNVATAIDPTYKRSHSSDQQATPASPVLPTPVSIQSGSTDGKLYAANDEVYDQLDEDRAPPYMPIQGQKRAPTVEKRKKKDGCKQQ